MYYQNLWSVCIIKSVICLKIDIFPSFAAFSQCLNFKDGYVKTHNFYCKYIAWNLVDVWPLLRQIWLYDLLQKDKSDYLLKHWTKYVHLFQNADMRSWLGFFWNTIKMFFLCDRYMNTILLFFIKSLCLILIF